MKKPSESAFIPNVSVGQEPLAIIKWPEGLSGSPAIFPMGETFKKVGEGQVRDITPTSGPPRVSR